MDVLDGLVIHLMCSYWFFNVEDVLIKSYKREPLANNNNNNSN